MCPKINNYRLSDLWIYLLIYRSRGV